MRHTYAFAHDDVLVFTKTPKIGDMVVIQDEDNIQHTGVINHVNSLHVTVVENNEDILYKNTYYYVIEG